MSLLNKEDPPDSILEDNEIGKDESLDTEASVPKFMFGKKQLESTELSSLPVSNAFYMRRH